MKAREECSREAGQSDLLEEEGAARKKSIGLCLTRCEITHLPFPHPRIGGAPRTALRTPLRFFSILKYPCFPSTHLCEFLDL